MSSVTDKAECLVSIIVPVYNVEPFLKQCLESLIAQTMKKWEAICINDGSTDGSGKILDDFAATDSRIKVIHKKNEGVSAARNDGLAAARAPYITMLDSDDYFSPELLQELYDAASRHDSDLVCSKLKRVWKDGRAKEEKTVFAEGEHPATPENIFKFRMRAPVTKLYKRDIIEKYHLTFPRDISICEDDVFVVSYWSHISSFTMVDKALYNYVQSDNSALRYKLRGRLPYDSYERTLDVPTRIYEHIRSHITDAKTLHQWGKLLIKKLFVLSTWMQIRCNNPEYVNRLRQYEYRQCEVFRQHVSPVYLAFLRLTRALRVKGKTLLTSLSGKS